MQFRNYKTRTDFVFHSALWIGNSSSQQPERDSMILTEFRKRWAAWKDVDKAFDDCAPRKGVQKSFRHAEKTPRQQRAAINSKVEIVEHDFHFESNQREYGTGKHMAFRILL